MISMERENGQVAWSVRDEGMGIRKEDLKHIFEKFYRVSRGNVHDARGHGLGLHYADRIMQLHHGNIRVATKFGEGTRFTVTFPVQN
jgi:two-component system phosphate regulon sensor histidine kinase PhoR